MMSPRAALEYLAKNTSQSLEVYPGVKPPFIASLMGVSVGEHRMYQPGWGATAEAAILDLFNFLKNAAIVNVYTTHGVRHHYVWKNNRWQEVK